MTIIQTHFLDSLSCVVSGVIRPNVRLLDMGTGAGFPSLPLKIYEPSLHVTAVDAVAKKIAFVRQLCRSLQFPDVTGVAGRIEEVSLQPSFEVIVSRAVGALDYIAGLAAPWLAPTGKMLFQRGHQAPQEVGEHADALQALGLQVESLHEVRLSFFTHPRYLVICGQISHDSPKNKA